MQLLLFIWFIFYNSTCFGRSPRPSSGVIFLQTVVAATGVCMCGIPCIPHKTPQLTNIVLRKTRLTH